MFHQSFQIGIQHVTCGKSFKLDLCKLALYRKTCTLDMFFCKELICLNLICIISHRRHVILTWSGMFCNFLWYLTLSDFLCHITLAAFSKWIGWMAHISMWSPTSLKCNGARLHLISCKLWQSINPSLVFPRIKCLHATYDEMKYNWIFRYKMPSCDLWWNPIQLDIQVSRVME